MEDFLNNLVERGVRDWYLLGVLFGLPKTELDAIEYNVLGRNRHLREIIYHQLIKFKDPASLNEVNDEKVIKFLYELNECCDCLDNPDKMTLVKFDHSYPEGYLSELETHVSIIYIPNYFVFMHGQPTRV